MENKNKNVNSKEVATSDIVADIAKAEQLAFGRRDLRSFNSLKNVIEKGFSKASEAYVTIGCALWQIQRNEYYRIDNYKNVAEFALDVYEIKKAATYNYIKVIDKFGVIENDKALGLREEFKAFKCSQLVAMLTFTPEQIEQVQPDWTVRKITEFGKALPTSTDIEDDEEDGEDSETVEADAVEDFMPVPEVLGGSVLLGEFLTFDDIFSQREKLEIVLDDLKNDANFQGKKIRFVLELIYD